MNDRPLPETIRGSWYLISKKSKTKKAIERPLQILRFRLDASFSIYARVDEGKNQDNPEPTWSEVESGDYTFDGGFLILRGTTTETYRVKRFNHWKWELEGNKYFSDMLRGKISEAEFVDLDEETLKEIRILPIRVEAQTKSKGLDDAIIDLVYTHDGRHIHLASFFTSDEGWNRFGIGLSPFYDGISAQTWERIIRESYFDMYLGKPKNIGIVTIRFLNAPDSHPRIFNYS